MIFILIGMPGAGKSSMGKIVARRLHMRLVDVDRIMESHEGMKLHTFIQERGMDAFCKLEEETLLSMGEENTIISTGGSAIYYPRAMEHFRKIGKVIYLYASLDTIVERIGDFSRRGVVMREGQTIEELYEERCRLYEKYADAIVNCDGNAYPKFHHRIEMTMRAFLENENTSLDSESAI